MNGLKRRSHKLLQVLATVLFSAFALAGCENKDDVEPGLLSAELQNEAKAAKTTVYYGPETAVGAGTARIWVETVGGKPVSLGIEMSQDALRNIMSYGMFEYALKLPGQAHSTGIKTIMLGWNPMGHEPEGVYSIPHFDFHFYLQTEGQIKQIMGGVDAGAYELQERVFPEFYTFGPVPFAVPHMGVHWSDVRSPEFSPAGFSRTFIYGSHMNRVTFLEPMITLEYLMGMARGTEEVLPVPALKVYDSPGYYPGTYTISRTTSGSYSIALTDLGFRNRNK